MRHENEIFDDRAARIDRALALCGAVSELADPTALPRLCRLVHELYAALADERAALGGGRGDDEASGLTSTTGRVRPTKRIRSR